MGKTSKICRSRYPKGIQKYQWECNHCNSKLFGNTEKHIKLKMKFHKKKCEKTIKFLEDFKKKVIADLMKVKENSK